MTPLGCTADEGGRINYRGNLPKVGEDSILGFEVDV
jgi:hypothetical protein